MKNLIKKQEEEFDKIIEENICRLPECDICDLKNFISKIRKETAEYICDKMTGKEDKCNCDCCAAVDEMFNAGYDAGRDERIKEEKEIKQNILKEFNIGGKQNETRTQRSANLSE